jgi:hypothetical protein
MLTDAVRERLAECRDALSWVREAVATLCVEAAVLDERPNSTDEEAEGFLKVCGGFFRDYSRWPELRGERK